MQVPGYFLFTLERVQLFSPGESILDAQKTNTTGATSHTAYGDDVTFQWQPVEGATSYVLKLGRAPWNQPTSSGLADPPSCGPPGPDGCFEDPVSDTPHVAITGGTTSSVMVGGAQAGLGRYCWTVWPVIDGAEQPPVRTFPYFCYTTEPAKP